MVKKTHTHNNNNKENYMRECDGDFSRVLGQKYAELCIYN